MSKFVQFGNQIINVERVTSVGRSESRVVVRFEYQHPIPEVALTGVAQYSTYNPT